MGIKKIKEGSVLKNVKHEPAHKAPEGITEQHSWDVMVDGKNKGRITRTKFTDAKTGKQKIKVFMAESDRTQSIDSCLKKNGLPPVQKNR